MALTLEIVPGKVFAPGELVSTPKLNQLGSPTIRVLDDNIVFIVADGSVSTVKLMDGVLSADAQGRAKMADGYFTAAELTKFAAGFLAANAAGRGLFADGFWTAAELTKFVDGFLAATTTGRAKMADGYLTVAKLIAGFVGTATAKTTPTGADKVLIGDAAASDATKYCTIAQLLGGATYAGSLAIPAAGGAATFTHGLGAMPTSVELRLVCTTNDAATGYVVNDEIAVGSMDGNSAAVIWGVLISATSVVVRRRDDAQISIIHKSTGSRADVSSAGNFNLRCYARL